jgi:acyl carrier protein
LISESIIEPPPDFTGETDLFQCGLDSMAIMQLLILIEDTFGVSLPPESVNRENFRTTRSLAALLETKIPPAANSFPRE